MIHEVGFCIIYIFLGQGIGVFGDCVGAFSGGLLEGWITGGWARSLSRVFLDTNLPSFDFCTLF
jgi:hypothetical protein